MRRLTFFLTFSVACLIAANHEPSFTITPEIKSVMDQISPDSMRGNLSFLSSDLLEGRDTPSRGLDIAAEFIASQFRKARLDPGGNDGYFQTAKMVLQEPDMQGFSMTLSNGDAQVTVAADEVQSNLNHALDLAPTQVYKLDMMDASLIAELKAEDLDGKVVMTEFQRGAMRSGRKAMSKVRGSHPALVIMIQRKDSEDLEHSSTQLLDPEEHKTAPTPRISISGKAAADFYSKLKPGLSKTATVSMHIAAPKQTPVVLKNVVGILRGSDPVLKTTCVVVSAHYDHIGVKPKGEDDRIYNGANDDGSGTVSVIEIANALSRLEPHPKRTIVFVTFFGEEKGLFGSHYYASHPAIPLKDTIADINLEQMGRTDSSEGPEVGTVSMTGYDYTDLVDTIRDATSLTGVKLHKNSQNSDLYFIASDNLSFAEKGVPAHTFAVAYDFPDYHGVGDEWPKIDYSNMGKVDRAFALAVVMLADGSEIPHWNTHNLKAAQYLKSWEQNHAANK